LSTGRITAALVIACRPDGSMSQSKTQSPLSSLVYAADSFASRAAVALIVAVLCVGMLAGFAAGVVPASWELTFDTVAAAVTLTMVFSIQHAQTRHQAAIQLKLDELLKASDAPDRAVKVETASDGRAPPVGGLGPGRARRRREPVAIHRGVTAVARSTGW
jgi:low affinity Fe/Cu permease